MPSTIVPYQTSKIMILILSTLFMSAVLWREFYSCWLFHFYIIWDHHFMPDLSFPTSLRKILLFLLNNIKSKFIMCKIERTIKNLSTFVWFTIYFVVSLLFTNCFDDLPFDTKINTCTLFGKVDIVGIK